MPGSPSPLDNTPDAREALWNRCYASVNRQTTSRSSSPSPSLLVTHPDAPQVHAVSSLLKKGRVLTLDAYENPAPRPSDTFKTLWLGRDPAVDNTFFRWDGSIGHVPVEAIQKGIRGFVERDASTISVEAKAGLVHAVANEMLHQRLSPTHATLHDICIFLALSYLKMVPRGQRFLSGGHANGRTEELEWLKYNAERRWWTLAGKRMGEIENQMREPSACDVDALFESYTRHSELSSSWSLPASRRY